MFQFFQEQKNIADVSSKVHSNLMDICQIVSRCQLNWLWVFFFCNCWDLAWLKFLYGYTQTITFSILSNSGRIFILHLRGLVNIPPLFTLITKNNNLFVKWLATDVCLVMAWLVSLLEEVGEGHSRVTGGLQTCVQRNLLLWFLPLDLHIGQIVYIFPRWSPIQLSTLTNGV